MSTQEAAERLVPLINELGAAGIRIEVADENAAEGLCLGTGVIGEYTHVGPANQTGTVWEVR